MSPDEKLQQGPVEPEKYPTGQDLSAKQAPAFEYDPTSPDVNHHIVAAVHRWLQTEKLHAEEILKREVTIKDVLSSQMAFSRLKEHLDKHFSYAITKKGGLFQGRAEVDSYQPRLQPRMETLSQKATLGNERITLDEELSPKVNLSTLTPEPVIHEIMNSTDYTYVQVMDRPGAGNACHLYFVCNLLGTHPKILTRIEFQNGPIQERGINGCQNEDLLAIVIHRLQGFQDGSFACRENALALTNIQEALMWLQKRTRDRQTRGVEGKSIK